MKGTRLFFALLIALALVVVASGTAAGTHPRMHASGSVSFAPFPDYWTYVRDTKAFTEFCTDGNPGSFEGTFSGDRVFVGCVRIYHDGRFNYYGTITLTGTVEGCGTGTVIFMTAGEGGPNSGIVRRDRETAIGGTLGVRGTLESSGNLDDNSLSYSGKYSC